MRKSIIVLALSLAVMAAACGKEDGYRTIVDEYAKLFLPMDEDGYTYDLAIAALGDYISGNMRQAQALEAVRSAAEELEERQKSLETYTVSKELGELLMQYDILPEEFEAFANERSSQLESYLTDLECMHMHLEQAEESDSEYENAVFWHDLCETIHDSERGYYYYGCVNYWFAGWEQEQVSYVQEQVIGKLKSYLPDTYSWENDQDVIEKKAMRYLDVVEDCSELAAEYEGQRQNDLYEMEQEFEKLKENAEEYQ